VQDCMVFAFDYDGVLAYPGGEPRPLGLRALLEALGLGPVYIVSGRHASDRGEMLALLRREGVPVSRLAGVILRVKGDEAWHKLEAYRGIVDREGCLGEAHDDNPEILYAARRLVSRGAILHYNDRCEPLIGYTILNSCRRP